MSQSDWQRMTGDGEPGRMEKEIFLDFMRPYGMVFRKR